MQKFRTQHLLQDSTWEINEKTDENRHLATTPNSASMFQQGCSARDLHKTSRECKREGMLSKFPCAALTTRNLTKSMEKSWKSSSSKVATERSFDYFHKIPGKVVDLTLFLETSHQASETDVNWLWTVQNTHEKSWKKALKSSNINTRPIPLFIEKVKA